MEGQKDYHKGQDYRNDTLDHDESMQYFVIGTRVVLLSANDS